MAVDLERVDHRPWPLPSGRHGWRQSWCDLLFAHWPVPAEALRPLVPEPLAIEEREGSAWVGVVPFRMEGVMRRPLPDLPGISAFPEINVRTYVELGGKPGVWFLSLDATNPLAVWAARRFFHLPYHRADIEIDVGGEGDWTDYRSRRRRAPEAAIACRYRPTSPARLAAPDTLERWLTERYCLYAMTPRGLRRTEVHHVPWPLHDAEVEIEENTMVAPYDLALEGEPLCHFASRIDVAVWSPTRA